MATIEDALFTHLSGTTTVTGLLGSSAMSINPVRVQQKANLPAVSIQRISGTRISAFVEDDESAVARFTFGCWADSFSEAKAVKEAVRKRIQRFSGTVSGVKIDDIRLANERHLFEDDIEKYQHQLDAIVDYRETT